MRTRETLILLVAPLLACTAADREQAEAPIDDVPEPVRAMGNEPFWHVDITEDGGMVYNRLGEEPVTFPYTAPEIGGGEPTSYTYGPIADATGAHTIRVVIVDEPCQDTMADQVHPMTSVATVDGEELHGCARPLDAPTGEFSVE